ncbi:MAG: ATPase [Bacteroidetes bacterium]|nr:MAG: ATPase [Bacteroidota bacterium]
MQKNYYVYEKNIFIVKQKLNNTMHKYKYIEEFEVNSSPRILFPYLQNPASLSEWFADKVTQDTDKVLNFVWDNSDHFARMVINRQNKCVRYEFLSNDKQDVTDPSFIEFKIQQSELTNGTFLKITDYSEMTNPKELKALWHELIRQLLDVMGAD